MATPVVFALRFPARPNLVALVVVRRVGTDRRVGILRVDALYPLDGTALPDVKPWPPGVDIPPETSAFPVPLTPSQPHHRLLRNLHPNAK